MEAASASVTWRFGTDKGLSCSEEGGEQGRGQIKDMQNKECDSTRSTLHSLELERGTVLGPPG